ncbi:MAG: VIT family protein [Xanthomonadaceae bacterium]|jgi:VIT1/CCC1 family predicted Fe2+/Mn2+ transporter|nr:VIT family protein [Xanthomonadaceae bacterium]
MPDKSKPLVHAEHHRSQRVGWLRAAVLGANDGMVSVAGLVVGVAVAVAGAGAETILTTGIAGLVAGAMSMAAGEYVSVQSQADAEKADLTLEQRELHLNPGHELDELTWIYEQRGLSHDLARQVAQQLTAKNALDAHARDELGITETLRARPVQAALASASAFCAGAMLPIAATLLAPHRHIATVTTAVTIAGLLISGGLAAWTGGAPILKGALRVGFWGAMAMGAANLVGQLFHV